MRKKIFSIALFCIAMVFGCSVKLTNVVFEQEAESDSGTTAAADRQTPTGNKATNILVLKADNSTLRTDTKQDATGEFAASTEGATAATDAIRDVVSSFAPDLSKKNSENPVTNPTVPLKPTVKPETGSENDSSVDVSGDGEPTDGTPVTDELGKGRRFDLHSSEKGYKTIRTTDYGYEFGKSFTVAYSNGFSFIVPDSSKRFAINGRETVYRPGGKGLNPQTDERGTSHGGMGIWTQKAGSSTFATIYEVIK